MSRPHSAERAQPRVVAVKRAGIFILICMLLAAPAIRAFAQVSFGGQANSPEEFDAYLLVLKETKPEKIITAASDFMRRWPQSEMVAQILELQSESYASLGDPKNAISSGETALAAVPNNLIVLTNLAYTIANSTSDPQQLARAKRYSRRVLDLSQTIVIPKKISPQEWQETRSHLTSTVHAALGVIAYKEGNNAAAIRELETAVGSERSSNPAHYYRLGLLYQTTGNRVKTIEMLRRAAAGTDPAIRQLAEEKLKAVAGGK
jgi:tetratricopeptide (TPR) repeat protein